ncbi:hypothetical protein AAF712_015602 [Marasmius tenuissimus]|uniref:Uncharacterized protein n=1 Tax=Marasmius tenuissimus TaxID=585030 RepID=A0ABR2ZB99_9AGAR
MLLQNRWRSVSAGFSSYEIWKRRKKARAGDNLLVSEVWKDDQLLVFYTCTGGLTNLKEYKSQIALLDYPPKPPQAPSGSTLLSPEKPYCQSSW